jgi:hypothetical protein
MVSDRGGIDPETASLRGSGQLAVVGEHD